MATYTTEADLEIQFGAEQLLIAADRDGDGSYDTDLLDSIILRASDEIDSYLATRYDLPFTSVPSILTNVCGVLVMYHLSADTPAWTEGKESAYKKQVAWLRDISKGVASLTLPSDGGEAVVQDDPEVATITQTRELTRTKLQGLF